MKKCMLVMFGTFLLISSFFSGAMAEDKVLTMSTTTSTESSGLLDVLLPEFKKDTGIAVKVLAKGTGAALKDGQDGNVDVVFVHALQKEKEFVEKGFGTKRYAVMHNDFIIIGPAADPAGIKGATQSPPWRRSQRARPLSSPGAMTAAPTPRNSRSGRKPL